MRATEAAAVRAGYAAVLAGESMAEIARRWNAAALRTGQDSPWTRHAVKECLTNPRYAGLRRLIGAADRSASLRDPSIGIVGGACWPALVEETTWRAAAAKLCDPERQRKSKVHKGLLTAVAQCAVCRGMVRQTGGRSDDQLYRCVSGNTSAGATR